MPQNTISTSSLFGRLSASSRSSWMSPKEVVVNVQLLHDSDSISNEFVRTQPAQTILDYVCEMKNIQEKDFLGLRYQDHHKQRFWLDLSRSINHVIKQFKSEIRKVGRTECLPLRLRFRYYPADPTRIRDSALRYQLFVQLQRDLLHGRLYCPQSQAAELAALLLQAQLGDYDPQLPENYVSSYKLLLKQTPSLEKKIASLHQQLKGKSSLVAELEFLEKASQLETYAFDPYTVKDPHDTANVVYIGASHKGILIFNGTQKAHHIEWSELAKVDYVGREIRITTKEEYRAPVGTSATLTSNGSSSGEYRPAKASSPPAMAAASGGPTSLKYVCPTGQFAKHLWVHILSQQAFFNEPSALSVKPKFSKPRIPLLSRGSTFRYPSRRVWREIEAINETLPPLSATFHTGDTTTSPMTSMAMTTSLTEATDHGRDTASGSPDGDVALSTSCVSMPTRYELPRQEPRVEQPWLLTNGHMRQPSDDVVPAPHYLPPLPTHLHSESKIAEKNNNDDSFLNVSFSSNTSEIHSRASPSTSSGTPTPTIASASAISAQPMDFSTASFTVFLVKREEVATTTTTTAARLCDPRGQQGQQQQQQQQGGQEDHLQEGEHLGADSDPMATEQKRDDIPDVAALMEREFIAAVESNSSPGEPLASSTPRGYKYLNGGPKTNGNGHMANGSAFSSSSASSKGRTVDGAKTSRGSLLTNVVFVSFLLLVLLVAVVIAVFERSEQSDWVERNAFLADLRHFYYEPARHFTVAQYRKYFAHRH